MKFNSFLFLLLVVLITTSGCCLKKNSQPNIIIFFTDDQGYGDVGCYGAEYETPNFDRLADRGIKFTNFYVPATVCTPSRAALLTGKYPKRVGLHEAVLFPFSKHGLSQNEKTLAEYLKELGYKTACFGKWHLGHLPQFMPNKQGFDHFYGVPYSNDMDGYFYRHNNFQSPPLPVYLNEELVASGPNQDSLTIMWTKGATDYIRENKNQPFFIYLAHNMPHYPLHVSERFKNSSGKGLFADVIQELDWGMGEVQKTLGECGIVDNTIIIFASDNGAALGSSGPLRGRKGQTWEGGQRVPGIISWPEKVPMDKICKTPVSSLDLLPTLVNIAGGHINDTCKIDGNDIIDLLKNPDKEFNRTFEFLYYARNGELEAFRQGDWKLHIKKSVGWNKKKDGQFGEQLYNLTKDISEQKNLVEQNTVIENEMKNRMEELDERISDNISVFE